MFLLLFSVTLLLAILSSASPRRGHHKKRNTFIADLHAASVESSSSAVNQTRRGIVMCARDEMTLAALQMIWQVQNFWKSTMGISIAHCRELNDDNIKLFESLCPTINIINVCENGTVYGMNEQQAQERLRSFYCKVAALIESPFPETMLVDLDVVWFKSPDVIFDSPAYKSTEALFFRDRINRRGKNPKGGIIPSLLNDFLEDQGFPVNESMARTKFAENGISFYWRHGAMTIDGEHSFGDFQESSVVLINKDTHPKTMHLLENWLPSFDIGYGDKEIYWIAATVAGESFSFEPFLPAQYGDCAGSVLHYDPTQTDDPNNATPLYVNSEYMTEEVAFVGEYTQNFVTAPVLVSVTTVLNNTGTWRTHRYSKDSCTCLYYTCREISGSNDFVNKYLLLAQWVFLSWRLNRQVVEDGSIIHKYFHEQADKVPATRGRRGFDCIPIHVDAMPVLYALFQDKLEGKDCPVIGCPFLPLTLNSSLPWEHNLISDTGVNGEKKTLVCDPASFDADDFLGGNDPSDRDSKSSDLRLAVDEARSPFSAWNTHTLVEGQIVRHSLRYQLYTWCNQSLHEVVVNAFHRHSVVLHLMDVLVLPPRIFNTLRMKETECLKRKFVFNSVQ